MKQSLKTILIQELKNRGELSLEDIADLCQQYHYKTATAERRLRPSENNGLVEEIRNPSGKAIIGYRYKHQNGTSKAFKLETGVNIHCNTQTALFSLKRPTQYD